MPLSEWIWSIHLLWGHRLVASRSCQVVGRVCSLHVSEQPSWQEHALALSKCGIAMVRYVIVGSPETHLVQIGISGFKASVFGISCGMWWVIFHWTIAYTSFGHIKYDRSNYSLMAWIVVGMDGLRSFEIAWTQDITDNAKPNRPVISGLTIDQLFLSCIV